MKFLYAFATLALFAMINANPYGSGGNYGIGYGGDRVAYVQEVSYGHGGYGGYGGNRGGRGGYGGYSQPLRSYSSEPRAAAAASASNGAIRPGRYQQEAVIGYDIDASYNGPSRGGYGRRGGY